MPVRKLSVAVDPDTVQRAAGLTAVATWEKEHGAFTARELARAERKMTAAFTRAARAAERNEQRARKHAS